MKFAQAALLSASLLAAAFPGLAATHARKGSTPAKPSAKHPVKSKLKIPLGIEDDRALQLQNALIQSGYLTGAPSGHWDATTEAAMQKLQADNGWQTKLVPDSRAIIKLGLGASTAYNSVPSEPGAVPTNPK